MNKARALSTGARLAHSISVVYSLLQRLRSLRHRFWYAVSERLGWSRGARRETPTLRLPAMGLEQSQRIAALQHGYQVKFELLFARVCRNLTPGGRFVMVNQGAQEAQPADQLCAAAGLRRESRVDAPGVLSSHGSAPAVLYCWARI